MSLCRSLSMALAVVFIGPEIALACYASDASGHQTRFLVAGALARDNRTGLVWQRCSHGLIWNAARARCDGELIALPLPAAIAHARAKGGGWRTPTGRELESLIDDSCGAPTASREVFPDIAPNEEGLAKYWTSSPVGMLGLYYNFDFMNGQADGNSPGVRLGVRFVRNDASPSDMPRDDARPIRND